MKTAGQILIAGLATVAVITVLFFAATGVACLFMTAPAITNQDECDVIQGMNGRTWCMNLINEPKAQPLPGVKHYEDGTTTMELHATEKINPQLTIQAEELQ